LSEELTVPHYQLYWLLLLLLLALLAFTSIHGWGIFVTWSLREELKGSALAAASSAFLRYTSRELVLLCITNNMTSISTHMEGGSRREEGREEEREREGGRPAKT
jgi:hypothetical protein